MKKKILILAGGYSKEREISIQTARAVFKQIKNHYNCKILDPRNGFIKDIRKFKPNVIFNALHGRYGEDGYIQLILENEKIKYTHSGVEASSICINKLASKKIFSKNGILSPKYLILKNNSEEELKKIYQKINNNEPFNNLYFKYNKERFPLAGSIILQESDDLTFTISLCHHFKMRNTLIITSSNSQQSEILDIFFQTLSENQLKSDFIKIIQ